MNVMLDILFSIIAGGTLLLTMTTTLFNVQANNFNSQMKTSLITISDRTISIIDSTYLSRVGYGVDQNAIITANNNTFIFSGEFQGIVDEIKIASEDSIPDMGFPLKISRNGTLEMGEFWLKEPLEFLYYDGNGDSTAVNDSIRLVKINFDFYQKTYKYNSGKDYVNFPISIHKYFKNLYLLDANDN